MPHPFFWQRHFRCETARKKKDVDPAEQAFIQSIPNQDPTERNMWAIGLLGDVADRYRCDEDSPQHKLVRYLQQYIGCSTGDGSTFDSHGITSMRTGETISLFAAAACARA